MGMTPVKTYDPERSVPILFEAGDYIRFLPVTYTYIYYISEQVKAGTYTCRIRQR